MADPILVANATMTADGTKAVADCAIDTRRNRIFGHLTQGWNGAKWEKDALTWKASAPVQMPAAERDLWEFGFVQVAEAVSFEAFYAGRIASEGSIGLYYFQPPALAQTILLDGGDKTQDPPWYRATGGNFRGNVIEATDGDHPGLAVPLKLENKVRSYVPNYLFHVYMDRNFWTVFTGKAPDGKLHYIASLAWRVRYEFKVRWANAEPVKAANASIVTIPATGTAGKPAETKIQAMLANPAPPRANDAGTRAQAATETGSRPNRHDLETRYVTVPNNFWTAT
jgi:hypothetical protein